MTDHAAGWMLAIDLGTSNTAAAIRSGARNEVLELSRASRTMPSGVILDSRDGPRVGEMAERLRALHPDTYEENPKGLVGRPPQLYGGRPIHAEEFVTEIFREVRRIALDRKAGAEPYGVVLTHPSAWGGVKTQQLRRAAESAGFERRSIVLVEEPIAAAHHFRHESAGAPLPVGGQVLVFDFGGGTLDLALVERTEDDEFEVKDIEAIENLGGKNLDEALWDWTLAQIEARHPGAVAHLSGSNGRREEATLREYVRRAKEDLSFRPATEIPVMIAGYDETYRPTAEEYEALISPLLEQGVAVTRTLLDRNDATKVVKFYLTGGSSLTPLVARALAQATGIAPTRLGDPKTVVADGALSAVASVASAPAQSTRPAPASATPSAPPANQVPPRESAASPDPVRTLVATPVPVADPPVLITSDDTVSVPPTTQDVPATSEALLTSQTPSGPRAPSTPTVPPPAPLPSDPVRSYGKGTKDFASVRWAFTAAALLSVSGVLLFLSLQMRFSIDTRNANYLAVVGLVFQAGAMAALFAHHLGRPPREGRTTAFLYAVSSLTCLVMAQTINQFPTYSYVVAHLALGGCLVLIGWRLLIGSRHVMAPFVMSLRTPAWWSIAAGASYILFMTVTLIEAGTRYSKSSYTFSLNLSSIEWLEFYASPIGSLLFVLFWPLAIFGMAAGYLISAVRLKRELTRCAVVAPPNVHHGIDTPPA